MNKRAALLVLLAASVALAGPTGPLSVPASSQAELDGLLDARQRDPFELDGVGDPKRQAPGVDLVLPYWMARYYNLVK